MSPTRRARTKRRLLGAPFWPVTLYLGLSSLIALVSGGLAPEPIRAALPGWLVIMWTLSLMCGGFLSFGGLMSGQNRVETAGCIFLIYGATLYGVVLAFEEWPHAIGFILVAAAIDGMCALRWRVLSLAQNARLFASEHMNDSEGI